MYSSRISFMQTGIKYISFSPEMWHHTYIHIYTYMYTHTYLSTCFPQICFISYLVYASLFFIALQYLTIY